MTRTSNTELRADLARLEGKLDGLTHGLERMEHYLDGNGHPGARDRLMRIETKVERLGGMADALTTHLADRGQHGPLSILRKDVLLVLAGMTGLMALLIELGGGAVEWLKRILGG